MPTDDDIAMYAEQRDRLRRYLGPSVAAGAETHVKDFIIRHQRMLGLGAEDVARLQALKDAGL